jgi:IMP dehydrogenase
MPCTIKDGITFDDVLLIPQHSDIDSRADVDISVKIKDKIFSHPIIPANMQTITGLDMAKAVTKSGGLAIVHRFMELEEQLNIAKNTNLEHVAFSVGIKEQYKEHVDRFVELGVRIFCVDIAHGDSVGGINMTEWIRTKYPLTTIISGNVATGSGARRLWKAGADLVKVGIGPGSLCTTRIETGCGVPQLTALIDVDKARQEFEDYCYYDQTIGVISDGGIKNAGDIVKALCFSDMVMAGNIFAGCVETPGTVLSIMGKTYKEYKGSSTHKTNHVEGVAAIVPTKGKFENILKKLIEGLRSGCSYQGARHLADLRESPEFVKITNAGLVESHPHNIIG